MKADAAAALHNVAVAASGLLDQAKLAQLVVERARVIAGGDAAVLRWFDPDSRSFRLLASNGTASAPAAEIASETSTAISEAFKTGRPVIANDYEASGRATTWGRSQRIQAQLAVPLLVEGRPLGTLAVLSFARRRYLPSDAVFLSLMAGLVAPALEAGRLAREVSRQAKTTAQIYEALPAMVVVYGRDGAALSHNSAAEEALGRDRLNGVRDRTLPLYREDGALIPDAERPFSLALRAKAPIRGTVVGYGFEPRKWAYVDAVPMFDENGDVDAVMTSSIDITQLKNAEARQRDDAARLRRLIAAQTELGAPDATVEEILQLIADRAIQLTGAPGAAVQLLDGKNVLIAACAGFGSELKDRRFSAKGNPINGCIADGGAESTTDTLLDPRCNQEVARITGIRSLVMAPIRHEGTVIGGLQVQSPDPSPFPDGTQTTVELLAGFAGAAISRVRVARALRDSEQLFSGAFQASGVGMALTTLDGSVIRANSSLCAMLGYTERELAGMSARQLVVPSDLEMAYDTLASLYRRSGPAVVTADLRVACKNGQTVWTRLTASLVTVDTEPRQVLIHLVDVSEERRARSILESEQQRLAVIIEAQREIAGTDVDLDRLLGVLIERTITLTAATAAAVLLPENDELTVRASAGIPEIPLGFRLPIESSLAGLAYRTGQIQQASNAQRDQRAHARTARIKGLGAIVSAPLVTEDGVIGVLQLISEEAGGLDETDARTLQMIGGFAAAAFQRATAARRLRDSEHRNRAVMEAAPESILVLDSNGIIVDFNPAAEHAFLRNRSEVVGESASLLLSPKHVDAFWRWNTAGQRANTSEYAGRLFESTGRRSDGTEFPMEIVVTDLLQDTRMVAAFVRDLTLRNRLKESSERLAAVVASAGVIVLACETNGRITLAEGSGLSTFNLTMADAVGRNLRQLLNWHADSMAEVEHILAGKTSGGRLHVDRPEAYLGFVASPILGDGGAITGISVVLSDSTARVRAEVAQRESEAKSRLMAMMNHEVRTPLNSILGFAHLMDDPQSGELNEKQRRYVSNIEVSGNHLLELVNDSLDLARLDTGRAQIELAKIPILNALEQAADQMRPLAEAKGLVLDVDSEARAMALADRRQLVQVLLNLLSNAIRHTKPGGSIKVSARRAGDELLVSVTDTGAGIAKEDQARLFEEFFQAANHAPGGVGLGLAICRRLVQMMGGAIEVASELGRGATFTIRLRSAGSRD